MIYKVLSGMLSLYSFTHYSLTQQKIRAKPVNNCRKFGKETFRNLDFDEDAIFIVVRFCPHAVQFTRRDESSCFTSQTVYFDYFGNISSLARSKMHSFMQSDIS